MQILQVQSPEVLRSKIHGYFRTSEEARFVHRLHGILLKIDQRESACAEIARLFGQSPRTVSNWINKVNKAGDIEVLRDAKRAGRKPRLGAAQLAQVREVLQKGPGESGVPANIWDGKSLSFYIKKTYGVELGVRQCQRLFHELGFSLKRARPVAAKGDPAAKAASKKTPRKSGKQ